MKKSKHSEAQISKALKEYENGRSAEEICRELGIAKVTFYAWKKKYSGMDSEQLKLLKALQDENRRLKQMYADAALDITMLKDVLSKKW